LKIKVNCQAFVFHIIEMKLVNSKNIVKRSNKTEQLKITSKDISSYLLNE